MLQQHNCGLLAATLPPIKYSLKTLMSSPSFSYALVLPRKGGWLTPWSGVWTESGPHPMLSHLKWCGMKDRVLEIVPNEYGQYEF